MLDMLRKRQENEEGFTLIELMVVVLIIAILLAIAVPTFLGARERAQDRAAQSDIRNALTAEKVHYTDAQAYTDNSASALTNIEPSLTYVNGLGTADAVGVAASATTVCMGKISKSGKVFSIIDIATSATAGVAGTYYGKVNCATSAPASTLPGGTYVKTGW